MRNYIIIYMFLIMSISNVDVYLISTKLKKNSKLPLTLHCLKNDKPVLENVNNTTQYNDINITQIDNIENEEETDVNDEIKFTYINTLFVIILFFNMIFK